MKGDAKLFVLEGTDGGNEILIQKIRGTFCDLNGELHIRFGNDVIEVRPRGNENIWDLRFDRDQAANAILERRKIPLDVNIYIRSARINHWIPFEYRHLLHFKEVLLDCSLENSQIDGLAGTEFGSIELVQPIVEAPQPRKFGVEREAAVVSDFTIIFMKPESGPLQGVSALITFNVFLGDGLILAVFRFRTETPNALSEEPEHGEQKNQRDSLNARDRFHWRRNIKTTACFGCCQKFAVSDGEPVLPIRVEV